MLPVLVSAWKLIVVQRQGAECLIPVKYLVTHTVGPIRGTCDGTMTSHLRCVEIKVIHLHKLGWGSNPGRVLVSGLFRSREKGTEPWFAVLHPLQVMLITSCLICNAC